MPQSEGTWPQEVEVWWSSWQQRALQAWLWFPDDGTAYRWHVEGMEEKRTQPSMLRCWEVSMSLPPNGRSKSRTYRALANSKVPRAPFSWRQRTTPVVGPLGRGGWAWNWLLSQQMGQKFVSSSWADGWNPGCDTLNLILLAIFNSQNISHLFPGFLTTWLPSLFASTEREYPEVFSLLASAKTKALLQGYTKVANHHCFQFHLRSKLSFLSCDQLYMPFKLFGKGVCVGF